MGLFSSNAGKATIEYGKLNQQVLQNWFNNNSANIGDRANEADVYLKEAGELFKPLSALGEKATDLYADSLGVNGAEGNARATGAFEAGPGYQFSMDQGLQALERRAAAQGRLSSGNTSLDTLGFAQGLAGQEFGGWQDKVGGLGSLWQQGIGGQANTLGARADTRIGTGDRISAAGDSFISGVLGANNQIASGYEAKAAAKDKMMGSLIGLGTSIIGGGLGGIGGAVGGGTSLGSIAKGVGQGLFGYGR